MTLTTDNPVRVGEATRIEHATALWSGLLAIAGLWWWLNPSSYPLGRDSDGAGMSLVAWIPATAAGPILVALGLVGLVTALAMRRHQPSPVVRRLVVSSGVGFSLVFLLVVPDLRILVTMGYASALLGPPAILGMIAAGARKNPRNGALLGVLVVLIGIALWVFGADLGTFTEFGRGLGQGLARSGPAMLVIAGAFAGGALWLLSVLRFRRRAHDRCLRCGRPGPRWMTAEASRGWGTWVTVAAALGPLPYGLSRMTWFTPWPYIVDHAELVANPALRIFGLSLGLAAIGGSVLTIGLIRPWGAIFPRWLPVLRGRAVPVLPPTIAALVVAGAVTIAGRSTLQQVYAGDGFGLPDVEMLLLLPFPVWGPLLAAAAVAYYLRRRGHCPHCDAA